jgi:hypothetical protein
MEQLSIYDELGFSDDPVYCLLANLKEETSISIGEYIIERTAFGMYEIKSDEIHECKQTIEACYKQLSNFLCPIESRVSSGHSVHFG